MIDEKYGHITCSYCNLRFQKVTVFEPEDPEGVPYADLDQDEMQRIMEEHWVQCTQQTPWPDDPEGY